MTDYTTELIRLAKRDADLAFERAKTIVLSARLLKEEDVTAEYLLKDLVRATTTIDYLLGILS